MSDLLNRKEMTATAASVWSVIVMLAVAAAAYMLAPTDQGKSTVHVSLPGAPLATVDGPASPPTSFEDPYTGVAEPGSPIAGSVPRYSPSPVDGSPIDSLAGGPSADPDNEVFAKCLDPEPLMFVVKGIWVWDQILGYLPCLHPGLGASDYIEMTAARLNVLRLSRPDVNWDEVQPGERYVLLESAFG